MTSLRQDSFAGGELAPELWARTSLRRYATGLRRCRNFVPVRSGAAVSRASLLYQGAVKNGDVATHTSTRGRLVPYLCSSGATVTPYLLELGNLYLRVWHAGAYTGTEVATPWAWADLAELQWAQEGNTLTLTRSGYAPRELVYDGSAWTLSPVSFDRSTTAAAMSWDGTAASAGAAGSYPLPDSDHQAKEQSWVFTQLDMDVNGNIVESAPKAVDLTPLFASWSAGTWTSGAFVTNGGLYYLNTAGNNDLTPGATLEGIVNSSNGWQVVDPAAPPLAVYPDKPFSFYIDTGGAALVAGGTLYAFRIYRGVAGGPFGWVGDVSAKQLYSTQGHTWTDLGDEPDYARAPPQGLNPFTVGGSTETPNAVGCFQQRRVFGGTESRPHTLLVSAVADYSNFDRPVVLTEEDSVVFALASGRGEQIRSLVWLDALMVLTSSSIWAVSGGNGPLAYDSVQAVPQSAVGASWLPAVPVGRALLYVRDGGGGVRSLAYSWERRAYADEDISLVSAHLLRGHTVTDWAYAAEPDSVLWMVRDDGVLLSLTLARDEQFQEEGLLPTAPTGGAVRYGWAWHDTTGTVESVCALREDGEDVVYLIVRRTVSGVTVRYLERLDSRTLTADASGTVVVADAFALDCAVTVTNAPASSTVSGLGHLEGLSVYAVADGAVVGPLTVSAGAVDLGLPDGATTVHVGLAFTPELETLDTAGERTRQKVLTALGFEVVDSRGLAVGPDSDHLVEWRQRKVSDSYGVPGYATELVRVPVSGSWGSGARAFLRQTQPLPVTVTGLTREVQAGG